MIRDIGPPLSGRIAAWPGDVPFREESASAVRTSVHVGAHVDAPGHVVAGGGSVGRMDPEIFVGRCRVIRVAVPPRGRVVPGMLGAPLDAPRILIATGTHPDPAEFRDDFAGLSVELADRLLDRGVRLVGVDTPSVDLFGDPDLPVHRACLGRGIAILEGLALEEVPEGLYELLALPLRLEGLDGSPVRAVLRDLRPEDREER